MGPPCAFCGHEVNTRGHDYFQAVEGWAQYRGRTGGTNYIALKQNVERYAHVACVQDRIRGVLPGQETLL